MKHAGPVAVAALEPLLVRVRPLEPLRERKPGTFYRRSDAFLHFHEDPAGLFADVKIDGQFQRFRVSDRAEQDALVALVESLLA
ncbi:MAG: hypothetical protein ABJD24_15770 [Acidimicrobiales bacterium]